MVSRYDRIRNASTTSIATVSGTTIENAATPIAGSSTRRISSVAYADEDKLSDANTARAVGLPNSSWMSFSVSSGVPNTRFLNRYSHGCDGRLIGNVAGIGVSGTN